MGLSTLFILPPMKGRAIYQSRHHATFLDLGVVYGIIDLCTYLKSSMLVQYIIDLRVVYGILDLCTYLESSISGQYIQSSISVCPPLRSHASFQKEVFLYQCDLLLFVSWLNFREKKGHGSFNERFILL